MHKAKLTGNALYNALYNAVNEMADGLIDADLGGHLFKKRVALPGQGKRGATRTIVATRFDDRWVFLYGFGKNERSNISKEELTRISHQPSAVAAASLAVAGRTHGSHMCDPYSGRMAPFGHTARGSHMCDPYSDIASTMPSASFRPCAPPQRRCNALAANVGEICGLKAFQEVATDLLGLDEKQLKIAINSGVIAEVHNGNDQP